MRNFQSWMPAALSLALVACAVETKTSEDVDIVASGALALQENVTKPTSTYYSVRRDQRRCASPACGGYWITLVNKARLTCADGKPAAQCYVAEIELPEAVYAEDGDLVRGSHVSRFYPGLNTRYGVLKADFVLTSVLDVAASTGTYYLGYDTGIRCITTPCNSFGLTALNTSQSSSGRGFAFDAAEPSDNAALEQAFHEELGEGSSAGRGAVAFGVLRTRYDSATRTNRRELAIRNVYVTKEAPDTVCLVNSQDTRTTAWNLTPPVAAEFAANLPGTTEILEGRCSDARIICTFQYLPVHGNIDAAGEVCIEESNACAFRGAVIHAAGQDSKASGSHTDGICPHVAPAACQADTDCKQGFCGWNADSTRLCRPWAQLGETCEGRRLPEFRRFCAPELTCRNVEATGDVGGVCVKP